MEKAKCQSRASVSGATHSVFSLGSDLNHEVGSAKFMLPPSLQPSQASACPDTDQTGAKLHIDEGEYTEGRGTDEGRDLTYALI